MVTSNKIYFGIFLIFSSISCTAQKLSPDKLIGNYTQLENSNIELRLTESSFVLIDTYEQKHLPPFKCCDTLAYGSWGVEKEGFLIFNSPEEFNTSFIYMNVVEELTNDDSLYFYFDNPIEDHYKKFGEKGRELFYSVAAETNNNDLLIELAKKWDRNPLIVPNPKSMKLSKFYIEIVPKSDLPVRELNSLYASTLEYEIQQENSNVFRITLPQLSYEYFALKRLTDDYLKISGSKLIWDGQTYKRNK